MSPEQGRERETSSESKENIRGRHYLSLLASLNVLEVFELSVVGAEFLLVGLR